MSLRERLAKNGLFGFILVYYLCGYLFINQLTAGRGRFFHLDLPFEKALPFWPALIFAYILEFAFFAVAYLAVISTCLAYIWWNDGIRKIGAGRAAMFSFVGSVAAMLSAVPLLGEWPGPAQLIGGVLILGGLFVANRR